MQECFLLLYLISHVINMERNERRAERNKVETRSKIFEVRKQDIKNEVNKQRKEK